MRLVKHLFLFTFLMMLFSANSYAEKQSFVKVLFPFDYERPQNPDPEQLSIVRYILKNTYEINIHRMRGEKDNQIFSSKKDGSEYVFDKNNQPVTNYNKGTYNYFSNETEPIMKFLADIAPWILFGSTADDPTSVPERLYYYTLDLDYGIQAYIVKDPDETLEKVNFNELSEDEKETYYIFLHLLFNKNYNIQLSSKNMQRLKEDGKFYYEYFFQIHDLLGIRQ